MRRHNFLKLLRRIVSAAVLSGCLSGHHAFGDETKPNFVLLIGDDMSVDDFGCYGHPTIRTPHIDRLARKGALFSNAFLTTSSCSPSRCSIITGRYPHNTGAPELNTFLPEDQLPFTTVLRKAGYYTALAGKWHLGTNSSATDAFDKWEDTKPTGAEKWVSYLQQRDKSKPFFMWFAAYDAHRGWDRPYLDATVSYEENIGEPYKPEDAVIPPYLIDDARTRMDLVLYYSEISRFDANIGKVVDELDRQGVADNTIIIVMADNGRPFPRCKTRVYDSGMQTPLVIYMPQGINFPGQMRTGLVSAIDIAPTVLELAGVDIPACVQGVSFSCMLENPATRPRRYAFSEHNWHDHEAYERAVRSERFLYVRNERPQFDNPGPADSLGSASFKSLVKARKNGVLTAAQNDIFLKPRPTEELFAVNKDRHQLTNLARDPNYQTELQELRALVARWQEATGDTLPDELTVDRFYRDKGKILESDETWHFKPPPGSERNASTVNTKGPI